VFVVFFVELAADGDDDDADAVSASGVAELVPDDDYGQSGAAADAGLFVDTAQGLAHGPDQVPDLPAHLQSKLRHEGTLAAHPQASAHVQCVRRPVKLSKVMT